MYQVLLSRKARQFYEGADPPLQRKLDRCFEVLLEDPRRHPNIKPLKGKLAGYLRYRAGDHRVVYQIQEAEQVVIVAVIAHRRESYE